MSRSIIFVVLICFTEIHRNVGCDIVERLSCCIAPGVKFHNKVLSRASRA
jgi:hypothetical protein